MGSSAAASSIPLRPRFSWDIRSVPWTDGKGDQEQYARSVNLWCSFHDKLPDENSSKIPKNLRGIMLLSQLYGRALDLCKSIDSDTIESEAGVDAIVSAIHKRDALAVISDVYNDFVSLLNTKRNAGEPFKSFESRFEAQVARFNSHSDISKLPEALVALMLLANSNVDGNQRISVLAASSPREEDFDSTSNTGDYLKALSYSSVASVVRQCDRPSMSAVENNPIPAFSSRFKNNAPRSQRKLTPEQLADLKSKSICRRCKQKGHWASDHNRNGSYRNPTASNNSNDASKYPNKPSSVTFHMAHLPTSDVPDSSSPDINFIGPLLDDGAPYSGIGHDEFMKIQPLLLPEWDGTFDPLPDSIASRPYWQYGSGLHSSDTRKIIGSIMLSATSSNGRLIQIKHLIIDGSSQWIIGRNVTSRCNIQHMGDNRLQLPVTKSDRSDYIPLVDHDLHCFIPYDTFLQKGYRSNPKTNSTLFCATAQFPRNHRSSHISDWPRRKAIIDKVHTHVCGHSNYTDIKMLLERNQLWNYDVHKYLSTLLETCPSCTKTAAPKAARKVSLSSMSREFNNVVCIDHMFLDEHIVLHVMDSMSRYSTGTVVPDTSMDNAIISFDSSWVTSFWTPSKVVFDPAFKNEKFQSYLRSNGIEIGSLPPRRHNKNVLESKHRIIRDIYFRLKNDNPAAPPPLIIHQALRISNDLYGNQLTSAHELAKGYTRPVVPGCAPIAISKEILDAQHLIHAKRKLSLILRSKSTTDEPLAVGDMVEVYIKASNAKRGEWSAPKPILGYDHSNRTIRVPGKNGRTINASIEDVRPAIQDNILACAVQESLDTLDRSLEDTIDIAFPSHESVSMPISQDGIDANFKLDTGISSKSAPMSSCSPIGPSKNDISGADTNPDDTDTLQTDYIAPRTGDSIEVYWPLDDKYYSGTIEEHFAIDDTFKIKYDDGQDETLHLQDEKWRYKKDSDTAIHTHEVQLSPGQDLSSTEKEATALYYDHFQSKEFLIGHAQGLPSFVTQNAYAKEENSFKKTVKEVHVSKIPKNANVISSHVLYKVKKTDDGSLIVKARIAPHGNKDMDKDTLKKDSSTCPPVGTRMLLSMCSIFKWSLVKIDVKSAFLQTGHANRDVYVVPPRECSKRSFYWLLLTAAYGLVNANAKWQEHSDTFFNELGFYQLPYIPQLFYLSQNNALLLLAVKVVDDILVAGPLEDLRLFVDKMSKTYELGTIVYGPGQFGFYGLSIVQNDDFTISINGDEKLSMIQPYPIDRIRRKQQDQALNAVELSCFRSINGSIGWLGTTASPFCSLASSMLQQRGIKATVSDIVSQINTLRNLKKLGTAVHYKRPIDSRNYSLSILVFSDASRPSETGQLGFIAGLLIGDFASGSIFHTLKWSSSKSKRPVKSIGAAETLAAGIAIDEGKMLSKAFEVLLDIKIDLIVCVDSKDLFDTLSTCHNATDKSIRADVAVIRYEFETHNVNRMIWIPGSTNLSDPLTKTDSPLTQPLQLLLYSGKLPFDFDKKSIRASDQFLG